MCVLGVEGSEKKCAPQDNFWNSPNASHYFADYWLKFLDSLKLP